VPIEKCSEDTSAFGSKDVEEFVAVVSDVVIGGSIVGHVADTHARRSWKLGRKVSAGQLRRKMSEPKETKSRSGQKSSLQS